jgi:AraC-like DNA-binding protein
MSVDAIVAEIGYTDVSSFRRLFARDASLSPAQYRREG